MARFSAKDKMLLIVICIGMFMSNLDVSIVNIALPSISDYFDVTPGIASWTVVIYTLVLSSFLLTFGRMGDIFGFKRIFIVGMSIFTIGSLLNSMSGSISELLAFRALQAVGGGMMSAIAFAMTSYYLPDESRGVGLGYMSTMMALGVAVGPVLGGYLTEYFSWQAIFLINIPIGVFGIVMALRFLPDAQAMGDERLNLVSSGLMFIAMFSLIFSLNQGGSMGWTSIAVVGSMVIGIVTLFAFFKYERSVDNPLIEPKLIADRNVLKASTSSLFVMGAFAGAFVLLPYYFEYTRGLSTEATGLILMVSSIAVMVIGPLVGKVIDVHRILIIASVGAALAMISYVILSTYDADTTGIIIILSLAIFGIGIGMYTAPNTNYIFSRVSKEYEGVTSGFATTFRNIGSSFGIAVMQSVFAIGIVGTNLVPGLRYAFLLGAVLTLIGAALMWMSKPGPEEA